jgi:hypothetical protein
MGLQQFERRLERLVEGAFAKAFRGELQPIELGRRLTREMDLNRTLSVRGFVVPNSYTVVLSHEDFERFRGFDDSLERNLADAAREHARTENYRFMGPVEVQITASEEAKRSTFAILSEVIESEEQLFGSLVLSDGHRIGIFEKPMTIGRLPECAVHLEDTNVSRRHAEIHVVEGAVYVVDLDSTNGTRVNGLPIGEHRLHDGEIITVGTTSMRFEAE